MRLWLAYGAIAALALLCLQLLSFAPIWLDWGRELLAASIALGGVIVGLLIRRARDRSTASALTPPAANIGQPQAAVSSTTAPALTRSELLVLQHLASGLSNKALARALNVSENTIKTHLANVYSKLGVGRRVDAVLAAQRLGLVSSPASPPNFTRQGDGPAVD
jgi:DNA-binding CsgD family transcriptional regulator